MFALKYTDLSHHEVPPETQSEFNLIIYSPIIKGYPVAPKSLPFYIAFVNVQLSENVQSRPKLLVTSIGSVFKKKRLMRWRLADKKLQKHVSSCKRKEAV